MRVLVCGGAGYIGSNMTAVLAGEGHEPVVYDNLSKGHRSAIGRAEFVEGDLADYDLLTKTLEKRGIGAVMHFAALIEAGESVELPADADAARSDGGLRGRETCFQQYGSGVRHAREGADYRRFSKAAY